MTQEVQPLTWQKRTNLEEHQQFFAKINEIIANLAPTVGEAEAAIAQATAAISSANDAVATANAASTAASAAASQAQTAASTVAGYDGRLTAAEGDIAALQNADTQNVKINAVNQYAVGLTGNQNNIAGAKIFLGECTGTSYFGLTNKRASFAINDRSVKNRSWFRLLEDINGVSLIRGFYDVDTDGTNQVVVSMDIDVGGTTKTIELLRVSTDASGNVAIASVGGRSIK